MANVFPLLVIGLTFMMPHLIGKVRGRILEKTASACNGPCGQLALSCPGGQRIAVRDAVYSVQKRTPTCRRAFKSCNNPQQDVCCEQTSQDCSFVYPWEPLKMLHRNCSGRYECNIRAERLDMETTQCPAPNTQLTSQSTLNYVCINDSMVAEVCSSTETTIQGRTLFAMMDPRGPHKPIAGSVCTCIAETIKWPTTNIITVFLVDIRLNALASSECSNASLSVRSGNQDKPLHCQVKDDSRTNVPFVTILNNSNVATLNLVINHSLPEFVWLGFEANENEDIRLSCKLQGLSPVSPPTDGSTLQELDAIFDNHSPNIDTEKPNIPALIGGIVAAIILVAAVVALIIVLIIRKKKSSVGKPNPEEEPPEYDITYYSTTDEALQTLQNIRVGQGLINGSDSSPELYVSAEEVVANKRKSNPVQTKDTSTVGYSDKTDDDYTTAFEEAKLSESDMTGTKIHDINPNRQSTKESNYDRLNNQIRNTCDTILEDYDQLVPERRVSNATLGISSRGSRKKNGFENNSVDSNRFVVNEAYDDTNDPKLPERPRSDVQGKHVHYSETEKPFTTARHSNATYLAMDDLPPRNDRVTFRSTNQSRNEFTSHQTDGSGDIYNDAESEAGSIHQTRSRVNNAADVGRAASTKEHTDVVVGKGGISLSAESQSPVAAPRRKSRVNVVAK